MCITMHHNDAMTSPPTLDKVRVTVPVSPEVLDTFRRMAEASGMSVGKAMGEWLADTSDAASHMADLLSQARQAPRLVARELHAYAHGLTDETGKLLRDIRDKGRAPGVLARDARPAPGSPPSSNTGGKGRKVGGRGKP